MEFLTQFFCNLTSGIIRLGGTVGILPALYFFVLRPVLDTTTHAVDSANQSFEKSFEGTTFDTKALEEKVNKTIEDADRQVKKAVHKSFDSSKSNKNSMKLLHCVQRSVG